jgi:hypothetical protein
MICGFPLPFLLQRRSPRHARVDRSMARSKAALAQLILDLSADVEAKAAQGEDQAEAWTLLCRVEAFLADLEASQNQLP